VHVEPGRGGDVHIGRHADPDDHDIGRQTGAVTELDRLDPVGAEQPVHRDAGPDPHAVRLVQGREDAGDLGTEDTLQGLGARLEHGHVGPGLPGGRGHLEPDPAATDHDDLGVAHQQRSEALGVGQRAQREYAVQAGTRDRQHARRGAGRQQQLRVAHLLAVVRTDQTAFRVDGGGRDAGQQRDVVFGVPVGRMHEQLLPRLGAGQERLGQPGRSYGRSRSAPMSTIGSEDPSPRRVCAAWAPASPAPTITYWSVIRHPSRNKVSGPGSGTRRASGHRSAACRAGWR
jgi:hypothetical protein